ncbi:hypothetical protein HHI36_017164, partial [Cryptolaemus montrouzieri]
MKGLRESSASEPDAGSSNLLWSIYSPNNLMMHLLNLSLDSGVFLLPERRIRYAYIPFLGNFR